jgi:hypothetical protein
LQFGYNFRRRPVKPKASLFVALATTSSAPDQIHVIDVMLEENAHPRRRVQASAQGHAVSDILPELTGDPS